jgi:acetyl esterase
MGRPAAAG